MKYRLLIILSLLAISNGCSGNLFSKKEYDARNAFVGPNLVIPPNLDTSIINKPPVAKDNNYASLIAFQLLFNLDKNTYNQKLSNLANTQDDKQFLNKANSINGSPYIRNELNKQYLGIVSKNSAFVDKILNKNLDKSLLNNSTDYKDLSEKS